MNRLNKSAYRMRFTPANPAVFGSVDSYTKDKYFWCAYRTKTAAQLVREGKDSEERQMRVEYYPRYVSFTVGDRVLIDGRTYDVVYVPDYSSVSQVACFDCKELQSV
jgi:hypothetical protein